MEEHFVIGTDIGATWVRIVLSNVKGEFLARKQERIDVTDKEAISRQIVRLARELCQSEGIAIDDLKGLGIASAGPLDPEKGILINPTNIPFDRVPLTRPISDELGLSSMLVNDCVAGVLGEKHFGAGREVEDLVYITISTGIGGGAILGGNLVLGKDGNAAEIGHFTIDYEERLQCGCGKRGHWEAYCSGKNIPNFVRMKRDEMGADRFRGSSLEEHLKDDFNNLTAKELFDKAKEDDQLASELVYEVGRLNAIGFASVVNAYDPALITVGGSVALNNEDLVLDPIKKEIENHVTNRTPQIQLTQLAGDIGLYGAVAVIV